MHMPPHDLRYLGNTITRYEGYTTDVEGEIQRERLGPLKHGLKSVVKGLGAGWLWFPGGERLRPGAV